MNNHQKISFLTPAFVGQPHNFCFKLCLLFYTCLLLICVQHTASAESNVAGVEIEIITDQIDGDLVTDPIKDYLGDMDNKNAQNGLQDGLQASLQGDEQTNLWTRIKNGYAIPNTQSQYTTNHENWYAARPDYIKRMLGRSQKYLYHIVEEVEKRGMPLEIALLPMIESAFNPQANSRSAASGIWQFIPSTGKDFGLQQNWWIDNRRDVTAATAAALTYLQKLHTMFGAWDLALAAYNAGEGTVQRAINKNRSQGLPTDYQSLHLPDETKNYVPKLQAIKNIVTNPEKFGLVISAIPNRPYFARVTTPKQIDSKLAAQLAEISIDEFSALNPSYNRPVIRSTGEKHQLLLPVWAAERFVENLANYDKPLTSWQTYHAKRGERMENIAQKFGIQVSQLRDINGLSSANKIVNAQAVLVPANNADNAIEAPIDTENMPNLVDNVAQTVDSEPKQTRTVFYKVKRGETLIAIAQKNDISLNALLKDNKLNSNKVFAGQLIKVVSFATKSNTFNTVNVQKINAKNLVHHDEKNATLQSVKKSKMNNFNLLKNSSKTNTINARLHTKHIVSRNHIRLR